MDVIGLILAGGNGTRLWPLSRKLVPKQLLNLIGDNSLLQETSKRIIPIIPDDRQWVITNNNLYSQIKHQTDYVDEETQRKRSVHIMKEPIPKNTAPAILWAAFKFGREYGNDSVMVVLPSDHIISQEKDFLDILQKGIEKAGEGFLLTFGIVPRYPETGFGYIKTLEDFEDTRDIYKIESFVEKPDKKTAEKFINECRYLWNSGMFIFHIDTLLKEALKFCPDIYEIFKEIDPDNKEEIRKAFEKVNPISIDCAIMEHTKEAFVIKADIGWSDVGNWKSLYDASIKDKNRNVIASDTNINIDTKNSYIYGKDRLIVTIGLSEMAVVDTADALLVAPLDQTYRIREVVDRLKAINSKTRIEHTTVERPWGQYKVLQTGIGYKIKRIIINPKEKLSKQYHHHRSEHWIVVRGTAKVTNGEHEYFVNENESTFIPQGTIHRLENPGMIPLEIIETQCGSYLEEDDIVRIDDIYDR